MTATMDSSGRLVLPKAVRVAAGIEPGVPLRVFVRDGRIELEPLPREVRLVDRSGFLVAEPTAPGPALDSGTVRRTREALRTPRRAKK